MTKPAIKDPCAHCGHSQAEHWQRAGACEHLSYANGPRCPCSRFHPASRSFRADADGRVFVFGITRSQRGHRTAYSLELIGRNDRTLADKREIAHEMLRYVVGKRAAGAYAQAFRDEVLVKLPDAWALSDREIVAWLQAR